MSKPDPFCEWCRLWEERLWRLFVLIATTLTLAGAVLVAVKHLPLFAESPAAPAAVPAAAP